MWYEVLPSVGVIFGAMCFGGLAQSFIPSLIVGKPTLREVLNVHQRFAWLRDYRLTGDAYTMQGLEGLPDAEETKDQ